MIPRSKLSIKTAFYAFAILFVFVMFVNISQDYRLLAISSFLLTLLGVVSLLASGYRIISLPVILVCFLYLFHFGQLFLDVIFRVSRMRHLFFFYRDIDKSTYLTSLFYSLLSIGTLIMGALSVPVISYGDRFVHSLSCQLKRETDGKQAKSFEMTELFVMRCFAIAVLGVAVPALLYMDISKFIALKSGGYMATYGTYDSGIFKYVELLARLARPAVLMLLVALRQERKLVQRILGVSLLYYTISMLTGDRGTNAIFIVANLCVFFTVVRKPKLSDFLRVFILLTVLAVLVTTISTFRSMETYSLQSFMRAFGSRRSSGFFANIVREFGASIESVYLAIKNYPTRTPYLGGFVYLVSPLYISPVLPDFTLTWHPRLSYTMGFAAEEQGNLGGSLIGEAYANFGWLGLLWVFAAGILLGLFTFKLQTAIRRKSWPLVGFLVIPFPFVVLWARDYFVTIFNVSIMMGLGMLLCVRIISKRKKMKQNDGISTVCLVLGRLDYSGAEKIAVALLNELHKRGYRTHAILTATEETIAQHENIVQHPIYNQAYEESHSRFRRSIKRIFQLYREMKKLDADVYISFGAMTNIDTIIAGQFIIRPVVACERSNPIFDPKSKIARLRRKITYWLADGFVFQTDDIKALFSSAIQSRGIVIPNFVESFEPSKQVRKPQIVTVARLSNDSKNHVLLINAFSKFHKKHQDHRLVFCGDGPDRKMYEEHIRKLEIDGSVIFLGRCSNPVEVVQESEVFVLSSLYEGMPNALLEAMACGAACVSTDCHGGGARSLIDNGVNGILVPNQNETALAEAMELLVTDKEMAESMRVQARKVSESHSLSAIADMWEEFLRKYLY